MTMNIRPATPPDADSCGRIIYDAFKDIAERHAFPPDFPDVESATRLAQTFTAHPAIHGFVVCPVGGVHEDRALPR